MRVTRSMEWIYIYIIYILYNDLIPTAFIKTYNDQRQGQEHAINITILLFWKAVKLSLSPFRRLLPVNFLFYT